MADGTCSARGCDRPLSCRGYCTKHYNRLRKSGLIQPLPPVPVEDRFWAKVDRSGDCWLWTGGVSNGGYGAFNFNGRQQGAHKNRRGANADSRSGIRGVSWCRPRRCWVAYIGHNGKRLYIGGFPSLAEAEAAVIAKRNELFTHNEADRKSA
jgi:hypothetical protein